MSSVTRRKKVLSSIPADGGMPICFKFAKTNLSMKFFSGGIFPTGAPSGIAALNTPTLPAYRTMIATLPGKSLTATRPPSLTVAIALSLASYSARCVTSRTLPSE